MRRKRIPQVTYTVGNHTYSDSSITKAKQQAKDHAEWFLNSDGFTPRVLQWREHLLVQWRGIHSWEYRIMAPDQPLEEGKQSYLWGNGSDQDRQTAWRYALRHLAQITWRHEDGAEESAIPPFVTDTEDRKELISWCRFQVSYRDLRAQGYSDMEAHAMACGWTLDSNGRTVPMPATAAPVGA